ncbi:MAG: shikimate kinase [Thermostichales cyanobacterium BF4_bins_65]
MPTEAGLILKGVNVYLIGLMGSGKSTLGRALADFLGYAFLDTDQLIEQVTGLGIPEIFAREGEVGFRDWESRVLTEVSAFRNLVVATGGGIVERHANWGCLHHGIVVWLDVPVAELWQRLQRDPTPRPLLQTGDPEGVLGVLWQRRRPLYAQADVRVEVGGLSVDRAVAAVWQGIRGRLRA